MNIPFPPFFSVDILCATLYIAGVIKSFKDREVERLFSGEQVKRIPADVQGVLLRKLDMLDRAVEVMDLLIPPGNRLEALKGGRKGQYSIRINKQWRICFRFENGNAFDVEITDYH